MTAAETSSAAPFIFFIIIILKKKKPKTSVAFKPSARGVYETLMELITSQTSLYLAGGQWFSDWSDFAAPIVRSDEASERRQDPDVRFHTHFRRRVGHL